MVLKPFQYIDVCSGISAPTMAWKPLGWEALCFAEIESAPRAVLAHHYPNVPLRGDFTEIKGTEYGPVDLLVGGTPCQSFSVAGLRGGMADDRGNLALEFARLADRARPRWVVWENVPGVLSSDGGRDFGSILGALAELGYGTAYRVLDAQHFGVPQRRRRVFVVGYLGDWRRAAAVLFERHSMSGHPAPRREKGQSAPTIPSRSTGGGGLGTDLDCDGGLISHVDVAPTLRAGGNSTGGDRPYGTDADTCDSLIAATVASKWAKGSGGPSGDECQNLTLVPQTAHSLRGEGFDASEDGTGRGTPLVPVAFDTTQITSAANYSNPKPGDPCHPLAAGAHVPAVAFQASQSGFREVDAHATLDANNGSRRHNGVMQGSAVRRLTPAECEALQGFPRNFTLVPNRGKPMADGPRYKMLGNSMAVPVLRWIGERIAMVDSL